MAKTLTVFLAADLKKFNAGMKDAQNSVTGFGGSLKNMLGPALVAAGAAAGAFAVKLGVDGVKAAMEDQAAVAALATTLNNLNLAHDTQAVEDYIYELERAYGVADTELRPAYDRLVRSTKDTTEANAALKTAMDISAATGKSLETITDALGRAYDGNTVSLGRLGLGIDRTALATMSLEDIMATLSSTFAGQADASARTFEGQMKRLQTATDNLKEAFGAGLLEALGDTDTATQDLVETMEGLEPVIKAIGQEAGESASGLADLVGQIADLAPEADSTGAKVSDLGEQMNATFGFGGILDAPGNLANIISQIRWLADDSYRLEQRLKVTQAVIDDHVDYLDAFARGAHRAAAGQRDLNAATGAATEETTDYRFEVEGAQGALARMYSTIEYGNDEVEENTRRVGSASRATEKLSKSQEKLLKTSQDATLAFTESGTALQAQIEKVEAATAAVEQYAASIQQDLLGGFDLGGLAEGAMDEQGNLSAEKFFQGFDQAINQAEWFGNVLNELKARNVDQRLIEDLAGLGPEVGGTLAQKMIDGDGALLTTLTQKWQTIQDKTRELAMGLVPEFLESGRQSAIDKLVGMADQFRKDQNKFRRLGKQVGKQVGASFKQQIAEDVAEAVRQVEAAATAARAEAVARAQQQQAALTQQAVAEALSNLIRNNDQRQGRNAQPVLQ